MLEVLQVLGHKQKYWANTEMDLMMIKSEVHKNDFNSF